MNNDLAAIRRLHGDFMTEASAILGHEPTVVRQQRMRHRQGIVIVVLMLVGIAGVAVLVGVQDAVREPDMVAAAVETQVPVPSTVATRPLTAPVVDLLPRRPDGTYEMRCGDSFDRQLFVVQMAGRYGMPARVETNSSDVRITMSDGRIATIERTSDCSFRVVETTTN